LVEKIGIKGIIWIELYFVFVYGQETEEAEL